MAFVCLLAGMVVCFLVSQPASRLSASCLFWLSCWSFAPSFMTSVSAANQETADSASRATTEMLNYALNFRSSTQVIWPYLAATAYRTMGPRSAAWSQFATGDVTGVSANAMDSNGGMVVCFLVSQPCCRHHAGPATCGDGGRCDN